MVSVALSFPNKAIIITLCISIVNAIHINNDQANGYKFGSKNKYFLHWGIDLSFQNVNFREHTL